MNDRILRTAELCRGKYVLDVGCTGYEKYGMHHPESLFQQIKKTAKYVVGLDIKEFPWGKPDFIENVETMQLNRKFDVIVAGDMIEHVSNVGMMLDRFKEHMKEDSLLILSTPNTFSPLYFCEYVWRKEKGFSDDHVALYSEKTLEVILKRHGFEVINIDQCIQIMGTDKPNVFGRFTNFLADLTGLGNIIIVTARKIQDKVK
jgi:hypothetical protein